MMRMDKQAVDIDYFEDLYLPYIHYAVVSGDTEKLIAFARRFSLKTADCIKAVKLPIILNLINTDKNEMLALIESYRDWADEDALSRAVAIEGESAVKAVMYLLHKKPGLTPTLNAAAKALYRGSFELLDLIYPDGMPKSYEFLVQAANAFPSLGPGAARVSLQARLFHRRQAARRPHAVPLRQRPRRQRARQLFGSPWARSSSDRQRFFRFFRKNS